MPATEFVARFLGASNVIEGNCTGIQGGELSLDAPDLPRLVIPRDRAPHVAGAGPVKLVIRAEKLKVTPRAAAATDGSALDARVETVDYQRQSARCFLRAGRHQLQAINMFDDHLFAAGEEVSMRFRAKDCAAHPKEVR